MQTGICIDLMTLIVNIGMLENLCQELQMFVLPILQKEICNFMTSLESVFSRLLIIQLKETVFSILMLNRPICKKSLILLQNSWSKILTKEINIIFLIHCKVTWNVNQKLLIMKLKLLKRWVITSESNLLEVLIWMKKDPLPKNTDKYLQFMNHLKKHILGTTTAWPK